MVEGQGVRFTGLRKEGRKEISGLLSGIILERVIGEQMEWNPRPTIQDYFGNTFAIHHSPISYPQTLNPKHQSVSLEELDLQLQEKPITPRMTRLGKLFTFFGLGLQITVSLEKGLL